MLLLVFSAFPFTAITIFAWYLQEALNELQNGRLGSLTSSGQKTLTADKAATYQILMWFQDGARVRFESRKDMKIQRLLSQKVFCQRYSIPMTRYKFTVESGERLHPESMLSDYASKGEELIIDAMLPQEGCWAIKALKQEWWGIAEPAICWVPSLSISTQQFPISS